MQAQLATYCTQHGRVLCAIRSLGRATVREIMDFLGETDRNRVAPRVRELELTREIRRLDDRRECRVMHNYTHAFEVVRHHSETRIMRG